MLKSGKNGAVSSFRKRGCAYPASRVNHKYGWCFPIDGIPVVCYDGYRQQMLPIKA